MCLSSPDHFRLPTACLPPFSSVQCDRIFVRTYIPVIYIQTNSFRTHDLKLCGFFLFVFCSILSASFQLYSATKIPVYFFSRSLALIYLFMDSYILSSIAFAYAGFQSKYRTVHYYVCSRFHFSSILLNFKLMSTPFLFFFSQTPLPIVNHITSVWLNVYFYFLISSASYDRAYACPFRHIYTVSFVVSCIKSVSWTPAATVKKMRTMLNILLKIFKISYFNIREIKIVKNILSYNLNNIVFKDVLRTQHP